VRGHVMQALWNGLQQELDNGTWASTGHVRSHASSSTGRTAVSAPGLAALVQLESVGSNSVGSSIVGQPGLTPSLQPPARGWLHQGRRCCACGHTFSAHVTPFWLLPLELPAVRHPATGLVHVRPGSHLLVSCSGLVCACDVM
jgi:hypothetical protein